MIPPGEILIGRRRLFSPRQLDWLVKFFEERTPGEPIGKFQYDIDNAPHSDVVSNQQHQQRRSE
jgi:hypothetical protein